MDKYIILPDITCDLSAELREFFGLQDYILGYVQINNKSLRTTLDWNNISRKDFYSTLSNKKNSVTSAAPSPEEYYQVFKKYVDEGYAVLSMSISSQISGTYNIASLAAKELKEEVPSANIYCFDSCRMSGSFGLLVAYACLLQKEGKSFEEVIAWLEENKSRVHQMGPIDDLTFVARRGQISKSKAIMGNLIGIKPMGDCNQTGYVTVLAKVKGIKKALRITAEYVKMIGVNLEEQYIFVHHTDREKYALLLKEELLKQIKCKEIFISDVFSGCGTNIGPGMIGVYFMGNPISENNEVEKKALLEAIEKINNQ